METFAEAEGFRPDDIVFYNPRPKDGFYVINYIFKDRGVCSAHLRKLSDGSNYGDIELWALTRLSRRQVQELCGSLTGQLDDLHRYMYGRMEETPCESPT